jgi:hypothetical protein
MGLLDHRQNLASAKKNVKGIQGRLQARLTPEAQLLSGFVSISGLCLPTLALFSGRPWLEGDPTPSQCLRLLPLL